MLAHCQSRKTTVSSDLFIFFTIVGHQHDILECESFGSPALSIALCRFSSRVVCDLLP